MEADVFGGEEVVKGWLNNANLAVDMGRIVLNIFGKFVWWINKLGVVSKEFFFNFLLKITGGKITCFIWLGEVGECSRNFMRGDMALYFTVQIRRVHLDTHEPSHIKLKQPYT